MYSSITIWFSSLGNRKLVTDFEDQIKNKYKQKNAFATSHARIALYLILKNIKLDKGDEVLMSPVTLPDMVNVVLCLGLRPVFVDFSPLNHSVDLNLLREKISKKTKVIYLTHLYGIVPELDLVKEIALENSLCFIQDTTQTYGALYGEIPIYDYADFSFMSTCALKDIHTHIGALIFSSNDEVMIRIKSDASLFPVLKKRYLFSYIKEDLVSAIALNRYFFNYFLYFFFSYFFNRDPKILLDLIDGKGIDICGVRFFYGYFARTGDFRRTELPTEMMYQFSSFQSEIGIQGLSLVDKIQEARKQNSKYIIERLNAKARECLPTILDRAENVYWRLPLKVNEIEKIEKIFFQNGIDPGKTTLPCLPSLKMFSDLSAACPIAMEMCEKSIYIPNYHYLKIADLDQVINVINGFFEGKYD